MNVKLPGGPALSRAGLLLFLSIVLALGSAQARWASLGPDGGSFMGAVVNPDNPLEITTLVAGTPLEYYRSSDGGWSWTLLAQREVDYPYRFQAFDFAKLYLLTSDGLERSLDGGRTWTFLPIPWELGFATAYCVDPSDSETIYAAGEQYEFLDGGQYQTHFAFIKSVDGGMTWKTVTGPVYDYISIRSVAVAKSNPSILYAAGIMEQGTTYTGVLLASTDGGATWSDKTAALKLQNYQYIYDVAVDPTNANKIYLAGAYPYYSSDGGATWGHAYLNNPNRITIDPRNPAVVYIGGAASLCRSTNSGQNWNSLTGPAGTCIGLATKPGDPQTLYISTNSGFFKSTNGGSTWTTAYSGIHHSSINCMAVSPSQPTTLAVENPNIGVYTTANSGASWKAGTQFTNCSSVQDLLIGLNDPKVVIALNGFT